VAWKLVVGTTVMPSIDTKMVLFSVADVAKLCMSICSLGLLGGFAWLELHWNTAYSSCAEAIPATPTRAVVIASTLLASSVINRRFATGSSSKDSEYEG
jgi:hypothetical protein